MKNIIKKYILNAILNNQRNLSDIVIIITKNYNIREKKT